MSLVKYNILDSSYILIINVPGFVPFPLPDKNNN